MSTDAATVPAPPVMPLSIAVAPPAVPNVAPAIVIDGRLHIPAGINDLATFRLPLFTLEVRS